MAKRKSKAIIAAADGSGGMAQVQDRRFETGEWPIRFEVPKEQADTWLQYLSADCAKCGWACANLAQMEAKENSGTITINTGGPENAQLAVIWERKRGGPIKVRARSTGTPDFPLGEANELFRRVNERSTACDTEQVHCSGQLCYNGLPWRGELWLDDTLRLGPPSQQDEAFLFGPRIILVNALINGIDLSHASAAFSVALRELAVFLSVVVGTEVQVASNGRRDWTWVTNSNGQIECDIRFIGYCEKEWPREMPTRGKTRSVPLKTVRRPDFSLRGIDGSEAELHLPADIAELWQAFTGLPPNRRRQFLQIGSMWQLALSFSREYQTARFAWMVAACEALKPPDPQFKDHNIYQVVEALLGKPAADLLQEQWFRPQDVRNAHLHGGEFRGSEFVQDVMMSSFQDPTFDQACRSLRQIAEACIIEWLRRSGTFTMPLVRRKKTWRRLIKDNALWLLPVLIMVGITLGWLLRTLSSG